MRGARQKSSGFLRRTDRATIHFLSQPLTGQLLQIPADRMLRNAKLPGQIHADHPAFFLQRLVDQRLALIRESIIIEQVNLVEFCLFA